MVNGKSKSIAAGTRLPHAKMRRARQLAAGASFLQEFENTDVLRYYRVAIVFVDDQEFPGSRNGADCARGIFTKVSRRDSASGQDVHG